MCGITAIYGNNIINKLIKSLKELQNRGYDSAGISYTNENNELITFKYASTKNENAISKLEKNTFGQSNVGISHTRWATHGKKCDINSHPHISNNGKFSLVHNGIIENYQTLKNELIHKNFTFNSETDSEVIVNLLEYYYSNNNDIIESIKFLNKKLKGTWAVVILFKGKIYATKFENPLVIGKSNENDIIITSEQYGFYNSVAEYFCLNNYDIFETNEFEKYKNTYPNIKIPNEIITELGLYSHWTIKEICEQPESVLRTIILDGRIKDNKIVLEGLYNNLNNLIDTENIILLGCGTSYNACLLGKYYFQEFCRFNIFVFDGSEFNEVDIPTKGKSVMILLSQSGETKDLHRCIHIGRKNNLFLIGIINVQNSMIAREVDCGCYLNVGREVAVASTKSYTSQVVLLSMVAKWFSQNIPLLNSQPDNYFEDIDKLYLHIKEIINNRKIIKSFLHLFENCHSCFILGKGKVYPIAREGSLKIKEISYIHAEDYPLGALKHGPFALLTSDVVVIIISIKEDSISKVLNCYNEIISRGSKILVISDQENKENYKNFIQIPKNNNFGELLSNIPLQILAYELSISKGINPDIPRNLAKVVTVE